MLNHFDIPRHCKDQPIVIHSDMPAKSCEAIHFDSGFRRNILYPYTTSQKQSVFTIRICVGITFSSESLNLRKLKIIY